MKIAPVSGFAFPLLVPVVAMVAVLTACSSTRPSVSKDAAGADLGSGRSEADVTPKSSVPSAGNAGVSPKAGGVSQADVTTRTLDDAFFDFDRWTLRDNARKALADDAEMLRGNGSARIVIEGHCDERGSREYNLALGEKRAEAAAEYLETLGIDAGRISIVSYGKERPFKPGHDEADWAANRRAHLVLASR